MEDVVDKLLTGKSGLTATISKNSIKEILSGEASEKSFDLKTRLRKELRQAGFLARLGNSIYLMTKIA